MNDQQQITPTRNPVLGPFNLGLIALAAVAVVWFVMQSRIPANGALDWNLKEMLPAGCIYGLVAAGCWLATAIDHRYFRFGVRAAMVLAAAWLFGQLRDARPWPQLVADFSGLVAAQSMIFFWFQVPNWQTANATEPNSGTNRTNQFGIGDIGISTFVIAILMALMIRYSPTIQAWGYWSISAAVWIGSALVTMFIAQGMTSQRIGRTLMMLGISLVLAAIGTYLVAIADSVVDRGQWLQGEVRIFLQYYGRIVWGYWLTFALLACCTQIYRLPSENSG